MLLLHQNNVMMDGTATLAKHLEDQSIRQLLSLKYARSAISAPKALKLLVQLTNTKIKSDKHRATLAQLAISVPQRLYQNVDSSTIASSVRLFQKSALLESTL